MPKVEIFDVEHGQCSLVTADSGAVMLIDAGHNATTGWRPSAELRRRGIRHIDYLLITNYDEDHASDLANVRDVASIGILVRNPTVTGDDLLKLKELGGVGNGIRTLCGMLNEFTGPITYQPDFGSLSLMTYYNSYPVEFEDENNLSALHVLQWDDLTFAYTGDLEVPGWKKLLERPEVRKSLAGVDVFLASHHGRLNGYTEEIFTSTGMSPQIIVISDSGIDYDTQRTGPLYRQWAAGISFYGTTRRVFTTRTDGTISIEFGGKPGVISTTKNLPRDF